MAVVAAFSLPGTLRRLRGRLDALVPGAAPPEATRSGAEVALPRRWTIALAALLPAFVLGEPPAARGTLALLAALAAIALAAVAAPPLVARRPDRTVRRSGLLALAAALAAGVSLGTGFLVDLLLLGAVLLLADLPEVPRPARLVLTTAAGALATDAGSVALGTGRGLELVALGAALTLFVRLVDEGPDLVLGAGRRRRPAPGDLAREGAIAFCVLVALVAYVAILSSRAAAVGVLGLDGWFALALFGGTLWLVWLRGLRAPGRLDSDVPVLLAAALTAAVTASVTAAVPGFPLP